MLRIWGPATVLLLVLAIIVVLVGGIITITNPGTLTFAQYLADLKTFALGIGALAVGRGLHLGLTGPASSGAGIPALDDTGTVEPTTDHSHLDG